MISRDTLKNIVFNKERKLIYLDNYHHCNNIKLNNFRFIYFKISHLHSRTITSNRSEALAKHKSKNFKREMCVCVKEGDRERGRERKKEKKKERKKEKERDLKRGRQKYSVCERERK